MRSDTLAHGLFATAAFLSAAMIIMVFAFMTVMGCPILEGGRILNVLWGNWSPDHHQYGIRAMILGTVCISGLGVIAAVPVSLGCAAFITVTAPKGPARILHALIRFMTGIPTVIYGFIGIFVLVPLVRGIPGSGSGLTILTAGMMLGMLVSPTMILFFAEGLARVPKNLSMAVAALGGTPVQRLLHVMVPQAWRSIVAGLVLGMGRAAGDTMIALMLAGNAVAPPESIQDAARTLAAHIALIIAADFDSPEFRTLFVCGLTLYLSTTLAVVVMRHLVEKSGGGR